MTLVQGLRGAVTVETRNDPQVMVGSYQAMALDISRCRYFNGHLRACGPVTLGEGSGR